MISKAAAQCRSGIVHALRGAPGMNRPLATATATAAATATATHTTEPSHSDATTSEFLPFSKERPYTHLPTPLPMDVREKHATLRRRSGSVTNVDPDDPNARIVGTSPESVTNMGLDEAYFPTSRAIESMALFQACLSTGLISRAHKLLSDMRADAHRRLHEMHEAHVDVPPDAYATPLKVWSYNAMLHAYLAKAAEPDTADLAVWVERAWDLWRAMMRMDGPPLDPRPDAATVATMALGTAHLEALGHVSDSAARMRELLAATRTLGIPLDAVFSASVRQAGVAKTGSGELPGALQGADEDHGLLKQFRLAATEAGDAAAQRELDSVAAVFSADAEKPAPSPVEGVAELRPVVKRDASGAEHKPFNLETLQESLAMMHEARRRSSDLYERQRWLEHSALDAARKRLEHDTAKLRELGLDTAGLQSHTLQTWMWDWYQSLERALAEDVARLKERQDTLAVTMETQLYPFLCLLPPGKLAMITILELMRMQGIGGVADGVKATRALLQVGKAIETEYHASVIHKHPEIFVQARAAQQTLGKRNLTNLAMRRDLKAWQERCENESVETHLPKWTQTVRARVGSYLVRKLMDTATVKRSARDRDGELWEEEQPAFYATYQYISGKKLGVIRLNEVVSRRLDKESVRETLHPRHLPMLVPPKPWLTHDSGGYFSVKTSAMRYKDSIEQSSYLRAASENNGLEVVLAGLDVLGNTAWVVNREVFDVVLQVWNSGEALADLPPAESHEPEPERPPPDDIKAKGIYLQRLRQWNLNRASNHSQRCDINYKLEIARSYLGERFYFPHNMDFRGRAYPIPPHLNHIGNDLCRGLLLFADAKPLGAVGLRWLRIHLANVWGYDKASFAEREQFAIDHTDDVLDSAIHPLDGRRWWLGADDPWQCLATCIELKNALAHKDGPEAFSSRLPVHQDGTCNGLQHYAALGGDLHGAQQVNLRGGDRPSDVYTGVAELVIKQLNERAASGDPHAQMLQGKVTRKVVKQTVMTTVYGVTFVGAKNQVMRQLIDRGDVPAESLWSTASYLAKVIMGCIGDLFSGANLIQEWLSVSARLIAKSIPPERIEQAKLADTSRRVSDESKTKAAVTRAAKEQMTSVIWTTALGLPIVQPYRKVKKHQVSTALQSVFIRDPNQNYEVNPSKQSSAFPPNFIHSLDATHMILTALECQSAGLVFASVHDSYWTHACDIDTMSDVIRDTFVRLHSQDILVRLRDEFLQRYKGYKIPAASLTRASMLRSDREALDAAEAAEAEAAEAEAEVEGDDEDDAALAPPPRRRRQRRSDPDAPLFYELADVLPPIPKKGDFDVNEIKRSLYFFS
mgnify:FL=1